MFVVKSIFKGNYYNSSSKISILIFKLIKYFPIKSYPSQSSYPLQPLILNQKTSQILTIALKKFSRIIKNYNPKILSIKKT